MRADHLRARFDRGTSADRRDGVWMPGLSALSLGIVVALVLVARPTHEPPPVPPVVAVLPPAPVEPPVETRPVEAPNVEVEAPAATPAPLFVQRSAASPRRVKWEPAASRPSRLHRPALASARSRQSWAEPSALSRVATRVAWAPYRTIVPRENTQSP